VNRIYLICDSSYPLGKHCVTASSYAAPGKMIRYQQTSEGCFYRS